MYKQPDLSHEQPIEEKTLNENATEKPMDVDDEIQAPMDNDLGPVDGGFMGRWKDIFRTFSEDAYSDITLSLFKNWKYNYNVIIKYENW